MWTIGQLSGITIQGVGGRLLGTVVRTVTWNQGLSHRKRKARLVAERRPLAETIWWRPGLRVVQFKEIKKISGHTKERQKMTL